MLTLITILTTLAWAYFAVSCFLIISEIEASIQDDLEGIEQRMNSLREDLLQKHSGVVSKIYDSQTSKESNTYDLF